MASAFPGLSEQSESKAGTSAEVSMWIVIVEREGHLYHTVTILPYLQALDVRGDNSGNRGRARGRGNRGRDSGGWGSERTPVWGRNEQVPREGACFYEDVNFKGQYFCVPRGATYTALPRGFNDKISSIRVFGSEVRVFQDRDFRGRSREIRSDLPNLRGDWKDDVSSIRVF